MASINTTAKALKALHVPSSPIIFPNIWDIPSLNNIISLNDGLNSSSSAPVKAVATASWAIAASFGLADADLSLQQNLEAISKLAPLCAKANLPLSVDIQDGYGAEIEAVVAAVIKAGAVGANIEDSVPSANFAADSLYPLAEQLQRLKAALKAAADAGCPDFVVNARCDVFRLDSSPEWTDQARMTEAVLRGKAYLDAGATTVFLFGGNRGLTALEVETLVKELDGRVAVKLAHEPLGLTTRELAKIGVARISVGPSLHLVAMDALKKAARSILAGNTLPAVE